MERIISVWDFFLVRKIGWLIYQMFHGFQLVQSVVRFKVISFYLDMCVTALVLSLITFKLYLVGENL